MFVNFILPFRASFLFLLFTPGFCVSAFQGFVSFLVLLRGVYRVVMFFLSEPGLRKEFTLDFIPQKIK